MTAGRGRAAGYDVIVAGYGGAGATAAAAAHDAGARVLVLEKAPAGGGSTAESGGSFATVLDRDGAIEHYLAITEGRTPRDVLAAYVDGVLDLPKWLADSGCRTETLPIGHPPFPRRYAGTAYRDKPHSAAIGERYRVHEAGVSHGGTSLWHQLRDGVERRGIEVRLGTAVTGLLTDRGRVAGVVADGPGGPAEVAARAGVVLATGGFGYSAELLREWVGAEIPAFGPPGRNDGSGLRMALEAGAALWHMNAVACGFGYKVPGLDAAWMCIVRGFGFLLVDASGRRFLAESSVEHHAAGNALIVRDYRTGEFTRLPSYLIFDEATWRAGPIVTNEAGANRVLTWSESNTEEIGKGWIKRADSLAGLARELSLPPGPLEGTVRGYNHAAVDGGDEFGRPPAEMAPLREPPFYGIPVWPALFNTQGGPRRGSGAEVIGTGGAPIPGLFSAGELGSIWGSLYPGAGNVTEAVVFGRIAGHSAAAQLAAP
jgi:succinate dehydrogenase/fumarate reductase flavoprotein subunit